MTMKILAALTLFILIFTGTAGAAPSHAEDRLIIRMTSGKMPSEAYDQLVDKVRFVFNEIDTYWDGAQAPGNQIKSWSSLILRQQASPIHSFSFGLRIAYGSEWSGYLEEELNRSKWRTSLRARCFLIATNWFGT